MDKNLKYALKSVFFLLSLLTLGVLLKFAGIADAFDTAWVDSHINTKDGYGWLLFILLTSLFTGVGLPRQVVSFLGGYAFGPFLGALLALAGTLGGCASAFYYSRLFGRKFVHRRFGKRTEKLNNLLKGSTFKISLIIRLMPVGSNVLTNILAGVSSAPAKAFIFGSGVGYIPQTLVFALLGSGVRVDPELRITLSILLFVVSSMLSFQLYRTHTKARAYVEEDAE